MINAKKQKRLTLVSILSVCILLAGSAFALTPGTLEIFGMIGVGDATLNVVWQSAATSGTGSVSVNDATIVDSLFGDANHGIDWAIAFASEGSATLTATARNTGTTPANITAADYFWLDNDTSLDVSINDTAFVGVLAPGATSGNLVVTVTWFGASEGISTFSFDDIMDYDILGSLMIDIVYEAAN
ncbi:MAG: hypothetical protein FWB96_01000 [Defluviitaleaceae bacterium]|nr:hypothetical protein [Defluviitaleaceae bacterium]MCL2262388.1 hypothetical protein [Defluviitaleaceae bacterium]